MTQFTYTSDGQRATRTAVNARTGNQTTTYTHGTTLAESAIATSFLLRFIDYPDSAGAPGGTDSVALTYNRQSERVTVTGQRGCVHQYVYDLLGRQTNDCVTTLGSGVDGTVLQFSTSYEVRGLVSHLTSFNSATPGAGTIINDVALLYNSFAQLVADAQSHSGGVVPGTTPEVQYAYADGSADVIRPILLTYPNGRAVTISYGTAGGMNDSISRVDSLIDADSTGLVSYAYLGLGTAALVTYPEPGIQYTLLGSGSGPSPAGDIYWGLDLFGRVIDSRWFNTGSSADIDRIKYGFDRASNRIWRQNPVATSAGAQFDEFYANDGLQRLKDMQRGTLNGTKTAITSPTFEQCWTLDPTGNWMGFNESTNGTTWTTMQSRTSNSVNEITNVSTGANIAYDAAGNMTTIPQLGVTPTSPTAAYWETLTVADWASMTVAEWSGLLIVPELVATYDAWNRLMQLTDVATGNAVQQNQYDARTFRTELLSYAAGVLAETRHSYFSSDWRCLEERVGTSTSFERQFVWGVRYVDDLVLRDRASERLFALQDANWNVTGLTDKFGNVDERYAYAAYGVPLFMSGTFAVQSVSSFAWETLYSGYRFDATTGLYCPRSRDLQPVLGIWIERDPFEYISGTSLVEYVGSHPLSTQDPYGLDWFTPSDYCSAAAWQQGAKEYYGYYMGSDSVPYPTTWDQSVRYVPKYAAATAGVAATPILLSTTGGVAVTGLVIRTGSTVLCAGTTLMVVNPALANSITTGAGTSGIVYLETGDLSQASTEALYTGGLGYLSLGCPQGQVAPKGYTLVTSWASAGATPDLKSGRWIQIGGPNRWNYMKTGLFGPKGYLNPLRIEPSDVPFSNFETGFVKSCRLCWPNESNVISPISNPIKGLLGQRKVDK